MLVRQREEAGADNSSRASLGTAEAVDATSDCAKIVKQSLGSNQEKQVQISDG